MAAVSRTQDIDALPILRRAYGDAVRKAGRCSGYSLVD